MEKEDLQRELDYAKEKKKDIVIKTIDKRTSYEFSQREVKSFEIRGNTVSFIEDGEKIVIDINKILSISIG